MALLDSLREESGQKAAMRRGLIAEKEEEEKRMGRSGVGEGEKRQGKGVDECMV